MKKLASVNERRVVSRQAIALGRRVFPPRKQMGNVRINVHLTTRFTEADTTVGVGYSFPFVFELGEDYVTFFIQWANAQGVKSDLNVKMNNLSPNRVFTEDTLLDFLDLTVKEGVVSGLIPNPKEDRLLQEGTLFIHGEEYPREFWPRLYEEAERFFPVANYLVGAQVRLNVVYPGISESATGADIRLELPVTE